MLRDGRELHSADAITWVQGRCFVIAFPMQLSHPPFPVAVMMQIPCSNPCVTSASSRGSCFLSCERKSTLCGSRSPVVPLCPSSLPLPCHSNAHPCTSTCHQPGHSRRLIIFALILSSQAMPFSFILPESHSNPHPHSTGNALLHILCWCRYTLHDTQRHDLVVLGTHRGATLLRYAGEPGGGSTCG